MNLKSKTQAPSRSKFRVCNICQEKKSVNDYYFQAGIHKGTGRMYNRCKKCHNKKVTIRRQTSKKARDLARAASKKFRTNNPEKHRESSARCVAILTDGVVANSLGMKVNDVPPPVIEVKRALIQLKREIKKHEKHK
jgi:hypothetical protein